MKREILTGIVGLATAALSFGMQTGNSPIYTPHIEGDSIAYIEEEIPIELGFDTASYLPEGFDAYDLPENIMDISYIKEDVVVELGFNVCKYLPRAFNPYKEYFDLNSIEYIEEEEVIEFDFDIRDYLPADFESISTF